MTVSSVRLSFLILVFSCLQVCGAQEFPEIIPHRGGRAEFPENTLPAFQQCIALGAKTLELDVQVTKDGVAVVYHPGNLSANTNVNGKIADYTYEEIKQFNAAHNFKQGELTPYRDKEGYEIPRLSEILRQFPHIRFVIDLKSLPAEPLVEAVAKAVDENQAWDRVMFYATSDSHLEYLKGHYPNAQTFESRGATIEELLSPMGSSKISASSKEIWLGFELARDVVIEETLALGAARYPLKLECWNKENIKRIRSKIPNAHFVMFGINTIEDYRKATELGANAVFTDVPGALIPLMTEATCF